MPPVIGWLLAFPLTASEPASQMSFVADVLPQLTKAGCNTGACHGAATGQGGLQLSLLGYDPEHDYQAITRELEGRRIDLATPARSLLLRKPSRELDHEGGLRIEPDSIAWRKLVDWMSQGAGYGPPELHVSAIEVHPPAGFLISPGESHSLRVTARRSDGTIEEVTSLALYSPNDDGIAEVSEDGVVTVKNPGLTAIMVRYSGHVAAVRVGAPYTNDPEPAADTFPIQNFIDEHVFAGLKRLRIPPSVLSEDPVFLRRVHLDVAGRLPTPDEIEAFHARADSEAKREDVIDRLLDEPGFVDFWTLKLADLLLINSSKMGAEGARAYHGWLRQQVADNVPMDRMVDVLLTAEGNPDENGPANFYRLTRDPRDMSEFVGQTLLGTQVACARCHNHPFDRWTMDDYHSFAAYFARTGLEGGRIVQRAFGEVQHPKTGRDTSPRPLGGGANGVEHEDDRRAPLAKWMTSPDNPMFPRAFVNRVWKELLGRGLVEPVDDLRPTNPPSNPALLDALADHFIRNGYDLRDLIRTIVSSGTYQLSSRANGLNHLDDRFFSRAYLKPLTAQVLADAIAQATGVPEEFAGQPSGVRAVELTDPQVPSYTLDVFGRCQRTVTCAPDSQTGGGLSQTLHLLNGPVVNARTGQVAQRLMTSAQSNEDRIRELYLRTLSRSPDARELDYWTGVLAQAAPPRAALEDLLWALLNSREFAFNH